MKLQCCPLAPTGSTRRAVKCAAVLMLVALRGTPTLAAPAESSAPRAAVAALPQLPGLRLQLSCEEPSGILWDRQTLATQTAVLLSLRVYNDLPQARSVGLSWRVVDATGKVLLRKNARFEVAGNSLVHRRELFDPPSRGAYRLLVDGAAKRRGTDDDAHAEMPFAIVTAPEPGLRPRSFFALDAPALVGSSELDFYQRIGARVLRSPLTADVAGSAALDQQMRSRWDRNLATLAVLSLPPRDAADNFGLMGTSRFASLIARYPSIQSWEIAANLPPAELLNITRAARAARPGAVLYGALPAQGVLPAGDAEALDGITVAMPPITGETHPAAYLRALLAHQNQVRAAGLKSFHVRENAPSRNAAPRSAADAAAALVTAHILAVMSGASGMSAPLEAGDATGPQNIAGDHRMARAAAFAAMTDLLEDTSFHSDLFAASPTMWGALFKGRAASIAVLWASREEDRGRLRAQLPKAEVLDVFGNTIARSRGKSLVVPLSSMPIYIVSRAPLYETWRALRNAAVDDLPPLAAQALPFTQRVTTTTTNTTATKLVLRVRLQNISTRARSGTLRVTPPAGWTLAQDDVKFLLGAGESRVYQFPVLQAMTDAGNLYDVTMMALEKRGRWQWRQTLRTATATNVRRGYPLILDGDLRDWSDAAWMELKPTETASAVSARVAVRWDARRLYIAARVQEPALRPRRAGNGDYPFWHGYDALQIAFGTRAASTANPARGVFHDTDYGFLLSPFAALPDGSIDGRVLVLSNPTTAFDHLRDQTRWGGAVPGARCVVRRLAAQNLTIYEASWPLSAMPDLAPSQRAASGAPVRFSWILHSDENAALQWSRATSVFPWWGNTNSFAPASELYLAAQTPLGFTANGPIDPGPQTGSTPSTAITGRRPYRRSPPVRLPRPRRDEVEKLPPPPLYRAPASTYPRTRPPSYTTPMSPSMLPPAAPPPGRPLPPSAPEVE